MSLKKILFSLGMASAFAAPKKQQTLENDSFSSSFSMSRGMDNDEASDFLHNLEFSKHPLSLQEAAESNIGKFLVKSVKMASLYERTHERNLHQSFEEAPFDVSTIDLFSIPLPEEGQSVHQYGAQIYDFALETYKQTYDKDSDEFDTLEQHLSCTFRLSENARNFYNQFETFKNLIIEGKKELEEIKNQQQNYTNSYEKDSI